jgi:hypothetical protein
MRAKDRAADICRLLSISLDVLGSFSRKVHACALESICPGEHGVLMYGCMSEGS